jgi:hypothetical protein
MKIGGKAFDNGLSPTFVSLGGDDGSSKIPVEQYQLAVNRECGLDSSLLDTGFHIT